MNRILVGGGEIVLALLLCLVSYAVFVKLLTVIFPSSTGLSDLIRSGGSSFETAGVQGDLLGSGIAAELEEAPATLTVINPRVTHKRGDGVTWMGARSGIPLRGRDGVQTASRGAARIDFDEHNHLNLGENTLIIIRETLRDAAHPDRRASVMVMEGDLWADLSSGGNGGPMALRVETPAGAARLAGAAGETPARLRVSVDRERATTFSVHSGEARLETLNGPVRLGPDQSIVMDSTGAASAPRALPASPALIVPQNGARIAYGDLATTVVFAWEPVEGATAYRFRLSRDEAFREIQVAGIVTGTTFSWAGVREGRYAWSVSAIRGEAEGRSSAARGLQMVRRRDGPPLAVQLPPSVVHQARVSISGTTDPAARVWIGNTAVHVNAAGRFSRDLTLRPGVNVVVVEAVDADGKSTYRSAIVNVKP